MKKTRILMAFLLIVAMMAFTACSNDNGTDNLPDDNGTVDSLDNGVNDMNDGVNDMNDNGVVDNNNNDVNTTGNGINDNVNNGM